MKLPKYEMLARNLLEKINHGCFPGGKLPAMSAIAREYKVNLQTANRAVKFLEQQGVVTCFAGKKGTVIDPARATLAGHNENNPFMADQVFGGPMRKKIRFLHSYFDGSMQSRFRTCAELFTRRYPWVEVEVISVDSISSLTSGSVPCDTALIAGRDIRQFCRRGELLHLGNYEHLAKVDENEFVPGIWNNCRIDGKLFAVPFSWSVPLCGCRGKKKFFSWQEPELWAAHPGAFNLGFYSLLCLFIGEPMLSGSFAEKEKELLKLLAFLKKICTSPKGGFDFWDNPAALRKFNPAENDFICGYYSNINKAVGRKKDWHYSALPRSACGNNILVTECLVTSAASRNIPESLLWLKFLQSDAAQMLFMDSGYLLPLRKNLLHTLPETLVKLLETALENAVHPQLSSAGLYRLYSCVYPLLAECFSGVLSAEETVRQIFELLHEEITLDDL